MIYQRWGLLGASGKNFNPTKVDGTCKWFFDDLKFCGWRKSNTSSLLWLTADPVCGKSVLSRAMIDERRLFTSSTTSTVCYFFFKDECEGQMKATDALCVILHQIFSNDLTRKLIHHAIPSHRKYGKHLTSKFYELWRVFLDCSLEAEETVCVLDALDEWSEASWRQLTDELNEYYWQPTKSTNGHSNIKFSITSRPYASLESSFKCFSGTSAYMRIDGDEYSPQISEDINLVINAQVNNLASEFHNNDRKKISERLKAMQIEHTSGYISHLTSS